MLNNPHPLDNKIFLQNAKQKLSYNDVFLAGDALFNNDDKALVLILCQKDIGTVTAYVSAIRHHKVPLLVDANFHPEIIASFIAKYCPEYIVTTSLVIEDTAYQSSVVTNHCTVYQRSRPVKVELHQDLALLIPTSGSTGDPKCVRLTALNIDSCTQSVCQYLGFDSRRVAISHLPIHYAYGLSVLHNCIYQRARFVLSDATMLDKGFWPEVAKFQVTDISGVPFMMKMLRRMRLTKQHLSSLMCVTQAGGHLATRDSLYLSQLFSELGIDYFTMYGQTEASPRIAYLPPQQAIAKAGSVGVPIVCGQVALDSSTGELIYQGDNVAMGYANTYHDLALGDTFQGVLRTGDIATLDDDGFISIVGRSKRFIKINGISVNMDQVERDLNQQFASIAVIGNDDKLIIVGESIDCDLIKQLVCNKYQLNKVNVKVKKLDNILRHSSGKIDYVALANEVN